MNLEVENLFDARPEARLGDGSAAPGYGRDVQGPIEGGASVAAATVLAPYIDGGLFLLEGLIDTQWLMNT